MMVDYIADPDGIVMKAGIVLMIEPLRQDLGDFHVKQMIEEESREMQMADLKTGVLLGNQDDRMHSESVFVMDQQIASLCSHEEIYETASNIGNQGTIYDEINGEKVKKITTFDNNDIVNVSQKTPNNTTINEDIDTPNAEVMKPPKDSDNSSNHVNIVASDQQTSPISVPLTISKEVQSDTNKPTATSMDENYHNIFTAILEETRIKAEKEATRRAIEVVSSGRFDSNCFEDIVSKSLLDYVMLYQKACELRYLPVVCFFLAHY